ncbi:MAG: diguanylate cyclase [Alphaproteobacteria bacterium]|nr:diguanylate cyclase [Alphaproteobacteria bacterium]
MNYSMARDAVLAARVRTQKLISAVAAVAILVIGLSASFVTMRWITEGINDDSHIRLDRLASRVRTTIDERFRLPVYGLRGLAASFIAHGTPNRAQFAAFVAARNLPVEFPGVRGFGYAERVARDHVADFVDRVRRDGAPDFSVRGDGDAADLYVVRYLEPREGNANVLGYDIGAERIRRTTIDTAIEMASPALSEPIQLVQDTSGRSSYLLVLPLYGSGPAPEGIAARRAAATGVIYVPMVVEELVRGVAAVADGFVEFDLFDGLPDGLIQPVYSYRAHGSDVPVSGLAPEDRANFFLPIVIAEQLLVVRAWAAPAWDATIDRTTPIVAFGGVALLSLALSFAAWLLLTSRARAVTLASAMTENLDRLAKVVERTTNGVIVADEQRRIVWVNEGFTRLTGYTLAEAVGRKARELIGLEGTSREGADDIRTALAERRSYRGEILNRAKDGRLYWVDLEVRPTTNVSGEFNGFMEIQSDITASKEAHDRLAASEAELRRAVIELEDGRERLERQAMDLAALAEQLAGERQKSVEALERLREAIESLSDAFCLFSPDGKIVMFNSKYPEPYGVSAACIVPGLDFEDILRIGVEAGLYPEAAGREEVFVRERAASFGASVPPREAQAPDGRWYRISRIRTPSGHTITSRVDITELKRKEAELAALNVELERLATIDPLTGVANRRSFLARADVELARTKRYAGTCAILALDIDHFKRVNDTYGHAAGDGVLVEFARRVHDCLRTTDLLGRIGGEEFAILAPGIGVAEATILAGRVLAAVRDNPISVDGAEIGVTVSIGISALDPVGADVAAAQQRADEALYRAKREGRDRYVTA